MGYSGADTPRQVAQVREQLRETFDGVVDDSDIAHFRGGNYEQRFLSRALAALAVRRVAKCSVAEAARFVTDGIADQGLDAIAPLPDSKHALLVQAKWSDKGTATFDVDAAKAMVDGLNRIENELYDQFNQRAGALALEARPFMVNERATLVIALMGTVEPSPPAREVIDNALAEFNKHGARMTVKVLYAADFHDQIHADLRPEPICLDVRLDDWYQQKGPLEAFQGTVSAESVAEWYETYGANLFEQNLRAPLGPTVTNAEIGQTLTSDPTRFWHLNNGITMICTSLTAKNDSAKSPQSRPTTLSVAGVSIVNGAQTVRAVARAMHDDGEAAANATLSIKVINTHGDGGFGVQVSQAANRQNAIEQRDHIALEPVHQAIKANLRAELRKQYVIKRGEPVAAPETGCSLDELALALACLHPDAEQAARAASSTENLWEQGSKGSHTLLFKREPSPQRVWRSVLTLRTARSAVYELGSGQNGREAATAEHGGFLITHLLFQHLDATSIDDPDFDWDSEVLEKIPSLVPELVRRLTHHIVSLHGQRAQIRTAFHSGETCRQLAKLVLADLAGGVAVPARPTKTRKARRPNTVPILVDRRVMKEGAPLRYVALNEPERDAMAGWLAEDESRRQATWVNHRTKPILWAYDQQQYSPSGLVSKMWADADWDDRPVANQGTARWFPSEDLSLWNLAQRIHKEEAEGEDDAEA
ncbi:AIPR family protein [Streptomyces sp. NBC_01498]|uniref:AIPR family protein n=1 Tax=Streptomyces sp. NBC_01498 TaxID=2975870 RepID=UPI002E7BBA2F|nr:AIPR family protein [Streptomyces sp. NBC_01498]WTL27147.1 AIPR family protein [Streptomyces sp. NBC_01498]